MSHKLLLLSFISIMVYLCRLILDTNFCLTYIKNQHKCSSLLLALLLATNNVKKPYTPFQL